MTKHKNESGFADKSKPLFIVFEGLDGSGKGTQIRLLADRLESEGKKVFITCEPTQNSTGGLVRDALGGLIKRTQTELAGLFLADRIAHCANEVNGIKKMLDSGITVICDRYYYSSFAYQGMDTDLKWVMDSNLNCPDILKPDLCIFLDVPPEICDERIEKGRASREIFEQAETIKRIRQKYTEVFKLLPEHNIITVNAAGRPGDISDRIYHITKSAAEKR